MKEPKRQAPFQMLGKHLKFLRENRRESLAEVSGAIEIDADMLERMENGEERPSEDLLMLLINHFDMQDHEAVQLWESAGYTKDGSDRFANFGDVAGQGRPTVVVLAVDVRTMYSDAVAISAKPSGLVMNFGQTGSQAQPLPVARVGMSYEQAEEVLRVLQQELLRHKYLPNDRLLSPGNSSQL